MTAWIWAIWSSERFSAWATSGRATTSGPASWRSICWTLWNWVGLRIFFSAASDCCWSTVAFSALASRSAWRAASRAACAAGSVGCPRLPEATKRHPLLLELGPDGVPRLARLLADGGAEARDRAELSVGDLDLLPDRAILGQREEVRAARLEARRPSRRGRRAPSRRGGRSHRRGRRAGLGRCERGHEQDGRGACRGDQGSSRSSHGFLLGGKSAPGMCGGRSH